MAFGRRAWHHGRRRVGSRGGEPGVGGMRARVGICVAAVATLAAVVAPIGASGGGTAGASATPAISAVPVRSSYETASRVLSRDIGVSVPLPDGHDLWLFGDTAIYTRSP